MKDKQISRHVKCKRFNQRHRQKIIIHLGDFPALMDFFSAVGRIYLGVDSRKFYFSLGCASPAL